MIASVQPQPPARTTTALLLPEPRPKQVEGRLRVQIGQAPRSRSRADHRMRVFRPPFARRPLSVDLPPSRAQRVRLVVEATGLRQRPRSTSCGPGSVQFPLICRGPTARKRPSRHWASGRAEARTVRMSRKRSPPPGGGVGAERAPVGRHVIAAVVRRVSTHTRSALNTAATHRRCPDLGFVQHPLDPSELVKLAPLASCPARLTSPQAL